MFFFSQASSIVRPPLQQKSTLCFLNMAAVRKSSATISPIVLLSKFIVLLFNGAKVRKRIKIIKEFCIFFINKVIMGFDREKQELF